MKKKFAIFASSVFFIVYSSFCAFAEGADNNMADKTGFSIADAFKSFIACKSAIVAAVLFAAAVILLAVFGKKLREKLNTSSSGAMIIAFIALFSAGGIGCLALALMTDGKAWSGMMHIDNSLSFILTQFSDYLGTLHYAGTKNFSEIAGSFSPLSSLIFLALAQFVPAKLILSDSRLVLASMTKNQPIMLLYLFLVLFICVSIYRMNRTVLCKNGHSVTKEIIAFLLVFSYPAIYCIELGNIAGLSLALTVFFILFKDSEKRAVRETALVLMGISAAVTPYTLVFIILLFFGNEDGKKRIIDAVKTFAYFLALFIIPAIFTGFGNALTYINTMFAIQTDAYSMGNTSIAGLLVFFGIHNTIVLQMITVFANIISIMCMYALKSGWQRATAAVYIMLNIFGVSAPHTYIFIIIPLVLLISEKSHTAKDWLYLLSYTLLLMPIPAWYYFDESNFTAFLNSFGLNYTPAANNLFALAAVQMMLILMCSQVIEKLKKRKTEKSIKQ